MGKEEEQRFDRAVKILDAVIAQASHMGPGYEDGLVAGMIDFLKGWFSDEAYRAKDDFGRGYRVFMPSPMDHHQAEKRPGQDFGRGSRELEGCA